MATLTSSKKVMAGSGNGPRTRVINLAKSNMTQAELDAAIQYLQAGDVAGTNDAHTLSLIHISEPTRPY